MPHKPLRPRIRPAATELDDKIVKYFHTGRYKFRTFAAKREVRLENIKQLWSDFEPLWREHGVRLTAEYADTYLFYRPWAWWRARDQEPRFYSSYAYLKRHGLLTAAERATLEGKPDLWAKLFRAGYGHRDDQERLLREYHNLWEARGNRWAWSLLEAMSELGLVDISTLEPPITEAEQLRQARAEELREFKAKRARAAEPPVKVIEGGKKKPWSGFSFYTPGDDESEENDG